jgi:hypothetical protein
VRAFNKILTRKEIKMGLGFMQSRRSGKHYELARFALGKLRRSNLLIKAKNERQYEHAVVANLQASRKICRNLITQVGEDEVEKITQANLFAFKHRPDVTIGKDGTAIEIKMVRSGADVRDLIGQAIVYRVFYRFVILVLIDHTPDRSIVGLCKSKDTTEYSFLKDLAENYNIFTVIGPLKQSLNLIFYPDTKKETKTAREDDSDKAEEEEGDEPVDDMEDNETENVSEEDDEGQSDDGIPS